ncbi:MAG: PEGA domain-containing protein [Paludibacteraceae bacterium]
MKRFSNFTKTVSVALACATLITGCASSTMIESVPNGATVYMDGERVGTTPYLYRDTKIVGTTTGVRLEREGYKPFLTSLQRNEEADAGAIVGGIFFLIPFLWTMKYKPTHTFELTPAYFEPKTNEIPEQLNSVPSSTQTNVNSKSQRLEELKKLYDEKLITKEDYEKQKQKILDEI